MMLLLFFFLLLCNVISSLYLKNANTTTTCGTPPELFYKRWQADLSPRLRIPFVCNSSDADNQHPLHYAFDGNNNTFWQSKAGIENAIIIADITSDTHKFLYVKSILITFGASQRPGHIKLSKSYDGGHTFVIWEYVVSLPSDCQSIFRVTYRETPFNVDDVLCIKYPSLLPQSANESVVINLSGGRGSGDLKFQNWLKATHVKLEFGDLHRQFDKFSLKWHHYNVREISIDTTCYCNGHASRCSDVHQNGSHVCLCESNTCGEQCDQCCPAFNQREWKPGNLNPFEVDVNEACQACNCYNHSDVCVFNQTVNALNASLNVYGEYSGGGVCQNCQHHTTGVNCQSCRTFYYNPENVDFRSEDACRKCVCNGNGSRVERGYEFLDCVRENNTLGMNAGDCFCKSNVHGSKCDTCRPGYFNLTETNPDGCESCKCFHSGQKPLDLACSLYSGQCNCKDNVHGLKCDVCRDGFYNLTSINPLGCEDCMCNLGGSRRTSTCDKTSGNCTCRTGEITGRTCNGLVDGYYYPSLHFLRDEELVRSNQIIMAWKGKFRIPTTSRSNNLFKFVFQCSSRVNVDAIITYGGIRHFLSDQVKVESSCRDCYIATKTAVIVDSASVIVDIMFPSVVTANWVSCSRLIGIPIQFYNSEALRNKDEFYGNCDVITNNVTHKVCQDSLLTLTMDFFREPFPCDCNTNGSLNNSCVPYMGQCPCKVGVIGRTCDQCQQGFYNFSIDGCKTCDCFGANQVCDATTGQCQCQPNTTGRMCDTCTTSHWNITEDRGCEPCHCSLTGAASGNCNTTTGQCECHRGVEGKQCHTCSPGYKNFTDDGCQQCNCSDMGSNSTICHPVSGQCPCKTNTIGTLCDKCETGTFYLHQQNQDGCLNCYCMGVTENCSMVIGRRSVMKSNMTTWTIGGGIGSESKVIGLSIFEGLKRMVSGDTVVTLTISIYAHKQRLFWLSQEDFFTGYGVATYGGTLEWYSEISVDVSRVTQKLQTYILLKSMDNATLQHPLPETTFNIFQKHIIRLHEGMDWTDSNDDNVTREQLLKFLSRPCRVYISASALPFGVFAYVSRIGDVSFTPLLHDGVSNERNPVENCTCPLGYDGLSCERCMNGFYRASETITRVENRTGTKVAFDVCVPCTCNGHASRCNEYSGVCIDCQHRTHGDACEFCLPGYYGNAILNDTNPCTECPCLAPYTETKLCRQSTTTGNVTCLDCSDGYTGRLCKDCADGFSKDNSGFCVPCLCNNNTGMCDKNSGHCIGCGFNTTGDHCEECAQGWFGDGKNQSCQPCQCDENGSLGTACTDEGRCHCKQNVVGEKCSTCAERSYGFNSISSSNTSGCVLCGCNTLGSMSLQCHGNYGNCSCDRYAVGVKCDMCEHGRWGLPMQLCSECSCDVTGSMNKSCTATTGQCHCKPGVMGRTCDACMTQHLNFSSSGCDECPPCTQLLQKKINQLMTSLNQMEDEIITLKMSKPVADVLTALSDNVTRAEQMRMEFDARLSFLGRIVDDIKNSLNSSVVTLQNKIVWSKINLTSYENLAFNETQRLRYLQNESESAFQKVLDANVSIANVLTSLDSFLEESREYSEQVNRTDGLLSWATYNSSSDTMLQINSSIIEVTEGIRKAQDEITIANTKLERAKNAIESQRMTVTSATTGYQNVAATHNSLWKNISDLQKNASTLSKDFEVVLDMVNNTKSTLSVDVTRLARTTEVYDNISMTINETESLLQNATFNIELTKNMSTNYPFAVMVESFRNLQNVPLMYIDGMIVTAENISTISKEIVSSFLPAESYGTKMLGLVQRIDEVNSLLTSAIHVQNMTNDTVVKISEKVTADHLRNMSQLIVHNNSTNIETSMKIEENQDLYNDLQRNVSRMDATSQQTVNYTALIYDLYPTLLRQTVDNRDSYAYCERALVGIRNDTSIANALIGNNNASMLLTWQNVTELHGRAAQLDDFTGNITRMVEEAENSTILCLSKLNDSKTIIESIDAAIKLDNKFNATKESLNARLVRLRKKLAALKLTIAKVNVPVSFHDDIDSITQTKNVTLAEGFFEVEMELKTTQDNALLMMVAKPGQVGYIKIWIESSLVNVEYETEAGMFANKNWEISVADGTWKRIHFSRMNVSSRLTVTSIKSDTSQTYGNYKEFTSVNKNTPSVKQIEVKIAGKDGVLGAFVGCIGFVKLNGQEMPLLTDVRATVRSVCNSSVSTTAPSMMYGASFAGNNGYIMQKMNNFSTLADFRVELTYRTFTPTSTLLQVIDQNKRKLVSLTILEGHLVYSVSFNKTSALLRSKQSIYSNGHVFKVRASVVNGNLSMSIYDNSSWIIETLSNSIDTRDARLQGQLLYIGGTNESNSGSFSGCIVSLFLSDNNGNLQERQLSGQDMLSSADVLFNGCFKEVGRGVRFYDVGSFSNITDVIHNVTELSFILKTRRYSGTILSFFDDQKIFFYLALYHGIVYMQHGSSAVYFEDQMINDDTYHVLSLKFSSKNISLNVDDNTTKTILTTLGRSDGNFGDAIIGYNGALKNVAVPVYHGLVGDWKGFTVNGENKLNVLVRNGHMVSTAGVSLPKSFVRPTHAATIPPTTKPPPSCAQPGKQLEFGNESSWVGFQGDSLLALKPTQKIDELLLYFRINFVITLEFRSIVRHGVLFFAYNENSDVTNNLEYIAVELVDGRLLYHFNAGAGRVRMMSNVVYSTGEWIKVFLIRILQFGAIMVSNTEEYHNSKNGSDFKPLTITSPLYLGGLPETLKNNGVLDNPLSRFYGCIRTFEIAETVHVRKLNLKEDILSTSSRNLRRCYTTVKPQVSLRADGYALANILVSTSQSFKIDVKMRTTSFNGLLWQLNDSSSILSLVQNQGRLELNHQENITDVSTSYFSWSDMSVWWKNTSYSLCDGTIRKITVDRIGNFFRLFVDNVFVKASTTAIKIELIDSSFYIGGTPSTVATDEGFNGCIEEIRFRDNDINLALVQKTRNMMLGCS